MPKKEQGGPGPRDRKSGQAGSPRSKPPRRKKSRRGSGGGKWLLVILGLCAAGGWYALHHPAWTRRQAGALTRLVRGGTPAPARHTARRREAARLPGCGSERWAVKTLADPDAGAINFHPEATTIERLVSIPRPASAAMPEDGRNPVEERVYQVHARLLRFKREKDQDIHLVLASIRDPRVTMVAEIPAGSCTTNSHYRALFSELQQDFGLRFGEPGPRFRRLPRNTRVVVTGVGFFDFLHGQSGMAPNGLELHPVVNFTVE